MSSGLLRKPPSHSPAERDSLAVYLREIGAYPLIGTDEEADLARRMRAGDDGALDKLVRSNLRFVVSVAKKYQNQGVSLSDLINEGNLGLIRAAHKFDETKGIKFISYAVWWIRQAILQALAEQSRMVRVPLGRAGALARLGRRTRQLEQELGREPTEQEIADGMNIPAREVVSAMAVSQPCLSLDAPFGAGADGRLLDIVADAHAAGADESTLDEALVDAVRQALSALKPRESKILRLYFGLDGERPMTLEQIGAFLGITRERVRQIKVKALCRLRFGRQGRALAAFTS